MDPSQEPFRSNTKRNRDNKAVNTTILIISDSHGEGVETKPGHPVDVVIHCGDLTHGSTLREYRQTLQLLQELDAPLKLVIPGNHDFTLDPAAFRRIVSEAPEGITREEVCETYGDDGEARRLFEEDTRIKFLEEGTYRFDLENGASLTVYASPFTLSKDGGMAFQYHPANGHRFDITQGTDIVMTHGPPLGLLDRGGPGGRLGCPDLFAAVARARPRMHCFGHVHGGWGAKRVAWRRMVSEMPSHFTDIEHGACEVIATIRSLERKEEGTGTGMLLEECRRRGYWREACRYEDGDEDRGDCTLFVNAALEGVSEDFPRHPIWIVDLELPVSHHWRESQGEASM
ncbi:ser/Thr protein phosphatase family protein [Xylaria arbuscula]|nr:ser/Thr protein phosphatase family protein [Xylaria arbuscula]